MKKNIVSYFLLFITITGAAPGASVWAESKVAHPSALVFKKSTWKVPSGTEYRKTLPNGLRIYIAPDHSIPLVSIAVLFRTGSLLDPKGKEGLGTLTSRCIGTAGTLQYPADTIDAVREYFAIDFSCRLDETQLTVNYGYLKQFSDTALYLLHQILFQPLFDNDKLEKERAILIQNVKHQFDNPEPVLSAAYDRVIYPGSENSRRMSEKSIGSITRQDVISFYNAAVRTESAIVSLSGDFNPDTIMRWFSAHFPKASKDPSEIAFPSITARPAVKFLIVHKPITQAYVQMGLPLFKRPNSDFYALSIFDLTFGGESFISRLGGAMRSDEGLTYSVYSRAESNYFYPGTFYINFFTKQESVNRAIAVALEQLNGILKQGITAEELTKAKKIMIDEFPALFRNKEDIVNRYATNEYLRRSPDHFLRYIDSISTLTREAVNTASRKYIHPDSLVFVIVGDTAAILKSPKASGFAVNEQKEVRCIVPQQLYDENPFKLQ